MESTEVRELEKQRLDVLRNTMCWLHWELELHITTIRTAVLGFLATFSPKSRKDCVHTTHLLQWVGHLVKFGMCWFPNFLILAQ